MPQKRLRIFAGPNGSGKSSLFKQIIQKVPIGYYINADDIEKLIIKDKGIDLKTYGISTNNHDLQQFLKNSEFAKWKSDINQLADSFTVKENIIQTAETIILPDYSAAIISDFIREENLKAGNDFSFETVMSHPDKLEFLKRTIKSEYHVYLYFICTDDVRVNIDRVRTRVRNGGHYVPEDKIKTRYFRSLELLYDALKLCYKSYLFDNSNDFIEIARIDRDKMMHYSVEEDKIPNWLKKYVIAKAKMDPA